MGSNTIYFIVRKVRNFSVPDTEILNFLILGKWYLNKTKLESIIGGAAVVGHGVLPWQSALSEVLLIKNE